MSANWGVSVSASQAAHGKRNSLRPGPSTVIGLSDGVRFVRHWAYVDNLGIMGCSRDEVARVLGEVTSIFEKVGLAVHDLETNSAVAS